MNVILSISMPHDEAELIDRAAKKEGITRSAFIRRAALVAASKPATPQTKKAAPTKAKPSKKANKTAPRSIVEEDDEDLTFDYV